MRIHLTAAFVLTIFAAKAQQFTLSASGGFNIKTPKQVTNKYNYGSGIGWQAGFKAEYSLKHWFVYAGAGVSQQPFHTTIAGEGSPMGPNIDVLGLGRHNYAPVWLTMPVGIGYGLALNKKTVFRFYGGVYGLLAVGGTMNEYICTAPGCPEPPNPETKRALRFGKNIYSSQGNNLAQTNPKNDLAKTNNGVQFGAGIRLFRKFELLGMYNIGLANISPDKLYGYSIKFNSMTVDLKYDIYSR